MKSINFQAHKSTDSQAAMITLRDFKPKRTAFNASELFEATVIDFDLPGLQRLKGTRFQGHVKHIGGPVFKAVVCASDLEHLDPAIAFQVYSSSVGRNQNLGNSPIASMVDTHLTVRFELGQPRPVQLTQQFEVIQPTVPTIKCHQVWFKPALLGSLDHVLKVVILAQPIVRFVVNPKVARQPRVTIGPHQRNQINPLHYTSMLARPVPRYQRHFRRIRLIQRTIINHQHPLLALYQHLNFRPQRRTIRGQALQQARIGVMRWRSFIRRCLCRFDCAKNTLCGNQKMDVVQFVAFGWIHALKFSISRSTA
jgi:hypothetical protein